VRHAIAGARSLATALLLLLAACATPEVTALRQNTEGLPQQAAVANVPFFAQQKYYCGPASLAMMLAWSGLKVSEADLVPVVYTPGRQGTLQEDIVAAARRYGRLAVPTSDLRALLGEIAAGNPVLVFQNLGLEWYPIWHYAVVIGYDLKSGDLVLHSGEESADRLSLNTFSRTWTRGGHWALTVLPPDRLPASATPDALVAAAAGLERAGRNGEAATAYTAITGRWPDDFRAWFGLGNARYQLGRYTEAEQGYRRALAINPKAPEVWNNLAYALKGEGRKKEAIAAAQTAVDLAGTNTAYRDTLTEMTGQKTP